MAQKTNQNPLSGLEQDTTFATIAALTQGKDEGGKGSGSQATAIEKLVEIMAARWEKEQAKEEEKEEELRRLLAARSQAFKEEIANREALQNACDHRKENGRPCVGGQKLSNNHFVFICQHCYRTWDEKTLPPHLSVNLDNIGG